MEKRHQHQFGSDVQPKSTSTSPPPQPASENPIPEQPTQKEWYQQEPWIVAMLVLFFPVGIYLMWRYAKWSTAPRWFVTVLWGGFWTVMWIMTIVGGVTAQPPKIGFANLPDESVVVAGVTSKKIEGRVQPASSTVKVNGKTVSVSSTGTFSKSVPLTSNETTVTVEADNFGEKTTRVKKIKRLAPVQTPTPTPTLTPTPTPKAEPPKPKKAEEPANYDLNVGVQISGEGFTVTNQDSIAWRGCGFELNPGLFRGGWKYNPGELAPGQTVTAPFWEFTKGDGTRFNAYATKPKSLEITCLDVGGTVKSGSYGVR